MCRIWGQLFHQQAAVPWMVKGSSRQPQRRVLDTSSIGSTRDVPLRALTAYRGHEVGLSHARLMPPVRVDLREVGPYRSRTEAHVGW